jgi:hypothetical protein
VKEERVIGTLREVLFVEEGEGDLSLNSIAFTEIEEARNQSGRTRRGLCEELRGEESGAK